MRMAEAVPSPASLLQETAINGKSEITDGPAIKTTLILNESNCDCESESTKGPKSPGLRRQSTIPVDVNEAGQEVTKAIRYKIRYENDAGEVVREKDSFEPWPELKTADEEDGGPVLEIITNVTIRSIALTTTVSNQQTAKAAGDDNVKASKAAEPAEPGKDDTNNLKINSIRNTEMLIRSQPLIRAIRDVVKYYPSQPLSGTTMTVQEPYHVLLHHRRELARIRQKILDEEKGLVVADDIAHTANDRDTSEHIELLQAFLDVKWKKKIEAEEERYARKVPVATFEMMWLLLKPGTEVLAEMDGELACFVMKSLDTRYVMKGKEAATYKADLWYLDFDGRRVGRRKHAIYIQSFDGEREVTNLKIYPLHMSPDKNIRARLIDRGRRYYNVLENGSLQVMYEGHSLGKVKRRYKERVILDPASFWSYSDVEESPPTVGDVDDDGSGVEGCPCDACVAQREAGMSRSRWAGYDGINPRDGKSKLEDKHFLMFPRKIMGFVLKTRKWEVLDFSCTSPYVANKDAINSLVMDPKHLGMVRALSHKFSEERRGAWAADFIQSKGEGTILLLHGSPGVGKTYTAECIAELTRRPLLSLTCADIGIDEKLMEGQLSKWFTLAEIWGAVMLIDEADVYLEARLEGDLQRNSLVSAFLRSMEYYRGILFLTTNRIGHIDDAIMSRVHLVVGYDRLSNKERKRIWNQFFTKLEEDRKDIEIEERARRYVTDDAVMDSVDWNGREIRNAFQTAVALAEYAAKTANPPKEIIELKKSHFMEVVEMSELFKKYLKDWKGDEADRALAFGSRNDRHTAEERAKAIRKNGQNITAGRRRGGYDSYDDEDDRGSR